MGKNVTFHLGPTVGLTSRQLTITRKGDAAVALYSAESDADVGAVTNAVVALTDNLMYEAKLVDTKTTCEVSVTKSIGFNTGSLQFPGPADGQDFYVYAMEDLSSSSSSSVTSSSSSSSSSGTSSSSSSSSS